MSNVTGRCMARSLVFSNGELYVGLDRSGSVRDIYFPHVGSELHTRDLVHRIGVWVDGKISWTSDSGWSRKARYQYEAPIGHTILANKSIGVLLEVEDFVDADKNSLIRNIHVVNLRPEQRSVRIFMHQAFAIGDRTSSDTAQYLPNDDAILHYSGRRAFVAGGMTDVGQSPDQHSVGLFGDGRDGTWRDAEDGNLSGSSFGHGNTDSTMRFSLIIGGLSSRRVHYWLAAGTSVRAATTLHRQMKQDGTLGRLEATGSWWRKWISPNLKIAERLAPKYRLQFIQSLTAIRMQIDRRGAVISAADAGVNNNYLWPREASYALWPLIRLGNKDEVSQFFTFCRHALSSDGYLMSKYSADGSIGAMNHPYSEDGLPPLQVDQTALVLFIFSQYYSMNKRSNILKEHYTGLVMPMAEFLSGYTDGEGLPLPSYDMSDSHYGVHTYTVAVTHAALLAAADLAEKMNDQDHSVKWRTAAEEINRASLPTLTEGGLLRSSANSQEVDILSLFGSFMFGLVDADSDLMLSTVDRLEKTLRRDDGLFYRSQNSDEIDYIGSLWMAQYYMEVGKRDDSNIIISAVLDGLKSATAETTSVAWLHAELISTLLDTLVRK